jgi:hypothetical protein
VGRYREKGCSRVTRKEVADQAIRRHIGQDIGIVGEEYLVIADAVSHRPKAISKRGLDRLT